MNLSGTTVQTAAYEASSGYWDERCRPFMVHLYAGWAEKRRQRPFRERTPRVAALLSFPRGPVSGARLRHSPISLLRLLGELQKLEGDGRGVLTKPSGHRLLFVQCLAERWHVTGIAGGLGHSN